MKTKLLSILSLTIAASLFFLAPSAPAAPSQTLRGHVPAAVAQLQPTGRLPATNRLHLAVALAPRNRDGLLKLLQDLQDPQSPSYHHYLSLEEFTSRFGPTEQDYRKAMGFARVNGLKVSGTYSNRIILDMEGAVTDVEKALHVTIRTYQHPKETREFYAPDTEPSLDLAVPLLNITGLDNYNLPHRSSHRKPVQPTPNGGRANGVTPNRPKPDGFSGPKGYAPADLRNAYVPGTTLTGAGQSVGLVEFTVDVVPPFTGGYNDSDLVAYETEFGLPHIRVTTVPVSGGLVPGTGPAHIECTEDIEMVMALAPGASIYVFECPYYFNDLLSAMVSHTSIKQFSSSWNGGIVVEPNWGGDFLLMEMAAQGQSFFEASGDYDAYTGSVPREADWPQDSSYATVVGGTVLTMNGAGASYASETVWNDYAPPNQLNVAGSGGGISQYYAIPYWQQGLSMTANHGSSTQRNIPDVAMVAINLDLYVDGSDGGGGGTSASAPLWAGFMALVNQQAARLGNPSAGFINPTIYALGQGTGNTPYASAFHDITTGNNSVNGDGYPAVAGYDLCTGWGTPAIGLINALAGGAAAPYHLVVLNTNDSGPGSLRQAISNAVSGAYITFSNSLAGATIRLTSGQLLITNNLTIDASALPGGITLNGNQTSRIFQIASGATGRMLALTLTNAYSTGSGGAILNGGVLSLANCTLTGNTGSGSLGGAIGNLGPLTLTGCTFSGNGAGYGGAILNQGTACTVQNCTFAGNTASAGGGGAIMNSFGATLNILHCTFTGNSGSVHGGDIINSGSQLNINNTILAASTPDDIYNAAGSTNTAAGSNIVQVLVNAGTLIGASTILAVNPQLAPLGNYGGPTQTQPPMAGSPAIDAAPSTTLLTDQRGFPRVVGPAPDIGAAEFQDASPIVTTAADSGIGSLRYATTYTTNGDYITFAPNLSGATILSSGTLTLNKSLTIDASALPGGIAINGNQAGSVFQVTNANVVLTALTITNGYATGYAGGGGGILNYGVLTLNRCTLAGNSSEVAGGIMNLYGILVVNESTLTGNSGSYGGGIDNLEGAVTVNQSTLTGNTDPSGKAGGVYDYDQYGSITIFNSIIAGNTLPNTAGNGGQAGTTSGIAVQTGVNLTSGNPLLAPLGNYGGPTPTMPPLPGSPALGAGSVAGNAFLIDQRGYARLQNGLIDIGAVELPTVQPFTASPTNAPVGSSVQFNSTNVDSDGSAIIHWKWSFGDSATGVGQNPSHIYSLGGTFSPTLTVTNSLGLALAASGPRITLNAVTSAGNSGPGTLRQAIANAHGGETITFASNLSGQTITLASTLMINTNLTIDASALPGGITINGNQAGSVFLVTNGNVVLTSLTITNGNAPAPGGGGGIHNYAALTLNQCTLAGNSAVAAGGILNDTGILVVNESTLTGNSGTGGGIYNFQGTVTVNQSTLTGNSGSYGGGILNLEGTLTVNQSTLTGNSDPSGAAGGLYNWDELGSITLFNSIVAGNSLPNTSGYNSQTSTTTSGITTQTGANLTNGNPLLAALGNYGGPTPTMPPLPGSPSIDRCTNGTTFATDQRGYPRSVGRAPDIGAVEGVYNPAGPGKLKNITRLGNGSVSFTLTNYSDMSFTVLASTNVALPFSQWSNLGTVLESPLGSGQYPFTDLQATNYSRRFYGAASQ